MIQSMVDRLAARLKQDGSAADGLGAAGSLLQGPRRGRQDTRRNRRCARRALAGDSGKLEQLDAALKQLDPNNAPCSRLCAGSERCAEEHSEGVSMTNLNRAGNTIMDETGKPLDAWAAEIPSSPISVAVSKPRPNSIPSGYMCQLRDTSQNIGRKNRPGNPRCREAY
jgi:hypothetical protein